MLFSWLCHSIWLLFIYNMLKLPVFLSHFADGSMIGGILLVTPLEFQERKHQPFPMTQSYEKECRILLDTLESFRAVP